MKRTTLVLMLLAILAVSCLVLTACHSCEFGEWTVIKQSTCTETGLKVQVCECGESRTEIIPATGHGYTSVATDSPCIGGYTTYTCGNCGDSFVDINAGTYGEHNFQQSDICEHCGQNIADVAVKYYKDSTIDVKYYVVPRLDGKYDAYIKGTGLMPDNSNYGGFFYGENKIISIYISDDITEIGDYVFNNCSGVTSIVIPDSVTTIGDCAFQDCSSLTNIVIPDSVTRIDARAFSGCTSLTSISIPDGVTCINEYTFLNCSRLTSIDMPEGVTSIGTGAFSDCKGLTSIVIPSSVTYIGSGAFEGCSSLTNVTIPSLVTYIGYAAFQYCESLTSMTFEEPYGWYVKYTYSAENTTRYLALNNASTNATYFTDTYCSYYYYWYKNN